MKKIRRFTEQFTLDDLDRNAISDLTAKWLFDREHGDGSNITRFTKVYLLNDKMYVHYSTYPTYSDDSSRVTMNGMPTPTKYYDTILEFDKAGENLGDQETFLQFNDNERAEVVRDYIDSALVRVSCNCPAFYFQGHWEDMSPHDSTIFKFPGPKGDGVWRNRHKPGLKVAEIRVCKHIASAIHIIDRDVNAIAKKLFR